MGFLGGFFRWFFGFFGVGFFWWVFYANPAWRRRRRPPTRPSSRRWATRPSGCGDRRTAPSRRSASPSSPRARFFSSDEPREDFFTQQLSRDYCSYNFLAKNTCNMCYVEDNLKNDPCVWKVNVEGLPCEYVIVWAWQYDPIATLPLDCIHLGAWWGVHPGLRIWIRIIFGSWIQIRIKVKILKL